LRSTNCSKVLCQHCRHLDKNISFVRAVRAHLDANDRGLQRGERTSTLYLILARGAASGSGQASTTLFRPPLSARARPPPN
jgi:hypothetical protein